MHTTLQTALAATVVVHAAVDIGYVYGIYTHCGIIRMVCD